MSELQGKSVKQKRKYYTWQERQKYYEAWKASGLTQIRFCSQNKLAIQSFSRWIKKLKASTPKLSFVPVESVSEKKTSQRNKNNFSDDRLDLEMQLLNQGMTCRLVGISLGDLCQFIKALRHDFADLAVN